ncbi:heavy metal-associated isoprenylated plant protein 27-like isoform X1 [Amaranthus tricolor]|uniref:heavy metal-associated isoprenylated plant protein 27-like isoform X1 n=1 Tax=Amaranthus tricolor TaxID=29722 RepID=UPI002582D387|nr:heavy metal-associated isoprenylated plant protein 27-like isoform X1 [Amaranthus tricolor]XP_057545085.1 heavy metal-associated isoprenylated plant protein 27-like isoform X1 [Amaranthus tricolor]
MRGLDFDDCTSCLSDGIKWLSSHHHNITRKPFKTVEIKVRMDCEGCERKVKKSVKGMKGVTRVETDPKFHKLTVMGYVDPKKVLKRVRHHTGKKAELWPYVPYDAVEHLVRPYAPGVYDKKAPPGYVRNPHLSDPNNFAESALQSSTELKYSTAFSDENPNACVIM